jgi:arabinose-5-phosphate isomerase
MEITPPHLPTRPSDLVRIEARALLELAIRLDGLMILPFARATALIMEAIGRGNKIIVLGIGKSGLIGRKIAATLRSTGTPAHFLHPAEALHGDLGMIAPGDLLLALSASGETEELLALLPVLQRLGNSLISLCGSPASTLAQASAVTLDSSVTAEACALNLAPTASTTVMLALGDALALDVSRSRGFEASDFANLHPGGRLGQKLARAGDLMHAGEALPCVAPDTPMPQVIHEMSHKKLGMTTVLAADQKLLGMISDGDLRRLLESDGPNALAHTAAEIMNPRPTTIPPEAFAPQALALMEDRKITSLIVTDPTGKALGVLHLHDLWTTASP